MGGGIFVYEALEAASGMLADSTTTTRHIILFSDAQDSEFESQRIDNARAAITLHFGDVIGGSRLTGAPEQE